MKVYGIWNRTRDRWARTPSGRRFQTRDVGVAYEALRISPIDAEVRVIPRTQLRRAALDPRIVPT